MGRYLVQVAYTPEAWAVLLEQPQHRIEAAQPVLENLGAHFESVYYAFGEYDVIFIMEAPDNTTAAAAAVTFAAGGALKAIKTTPLLTLDEGIEAIRRAGGASTVYRPPRR